MIAEKVLEVIWELDAMAHEFTPKQWEKIRRVIEELKDVHITASEIEKRMPIACNPRYEGNFFLREAIDG